MRERSARPTAVTILAVLTAVGGVLGIVAAVALLFGVFRFSDVAAGFGYSGNAISSTAAALGLAAYAILGLAFAYGAWTLKPWGWRLGLIVFAVGAVSDALAAVVGLMAPANAIVQVLVAALVIYYWFRPSVRAAFGRP
jgi:hypothetical protein